MGVLDSNFGLFEDGQLLGLAWIDAAHFTDHVTEKMQKQRTHQQTQHLSCEVNMAGNSCQLA